jgi:hypothetical protein
MAADADGHRSAAVHFFARRNFRLHHDGCAHCIVYGRKGGHDLIADGLDDRSVELQSCLFHNIEACGHGLAGPRIAVLIV